jgi:hypothetical protein
MTMLATIATDVLTAVAVGIAAAGLVTAVLALLINRQRIRVTKLAHAHLEFNAVLEAAHSASEKQAELIREVLQSAVIDVADDQKLPQDLVSSAIFASPNDGPFEIVPGLAVNIEGSESGRRAHPGDIGVGEAAQGGHPVITVFQSPFIGEDPQQRERVDPELRWVIAVPIFGGEQKPVWVLSVAGFFEPRSEDQLRSSVGRLLYYRELLELFLKGVAGESK